MIQLNRQEERCDDDSFWAHECGDLESIIYKQTVLSSCVQKGRCYGKTCSREATGKPSVQKLSFCLPFYTKEKVCIKFIQCNESHRLHQCGRIGV